MNKPLTIVTPGNVPERKNIDYNNGSDRKWMFGHITWCIHNARKVAIVPTEAQEESES